MTLPTRRPPSVSAHHAQRGVVLFVALIAMVVLSLAGVALLRSIDSSTSVVGNIAFRQASVGPVNLAIEKAIDDMFVNKLVVQTADDPAYRYYARIQPGEKLNGVPAVLSGAWPPAAYTFSIDTDAVTGIEVRAVIERVCNTATPANSPAKIQWCDVLPPKVSDAGTDNDLGGIPLEPFPHFRITVRADLPRTNAVSFAQAFVR